MGKKFYGWCSIVLFTIVLFAVLMPLVLTEAERGVFFSEYGIYVSSILIGISVSTFSACLLAWIIESMQYHRRIYDALLDIDSKVYNLIKLANVAYTTKSIAFIQATYSFMYSFMAWSIQDSIIKGIDKSFVKSFSNLLDEMKTTIGNIEQCCLEIMQTNTRLETEHASFSEFTGISVIAIRHKQSFSPKINEYHKRVTSLKIHINNLYVTLLKYIEELSDNRRKYASLRFTAYKSPFISKKSLFKPHTKTPLNKECKTPYFDCYTPFYYLLKKKNGRTHNEMLSKMRNYIPQGAHILEVTAGIGLISLANVDRASRILCVAISGRVVKSIRREVAKRGIANTMVDKQSIYNIAVPDSSYDVVIAEQLLSLIDEPEKAAAELRRISKSSVILPMSFTGNFHGSVKLVHNIYRFFGFAPKHTYNSDEYRAFLPTIGFDNFEYIQLKGKIPMAIAIWRKI